MNRIFAIPRPRLLPDNFTLALIGTLVLASFLPCRGTTLVALDHLTNVAIALLFFLHGAKLSRQAVIAGASNWRLHTVVFLTTFVLFPMFGFALKPLLSPLVTPALYAGILFLCTLPSTVQSSIALTAIAKGNVPAAICSASASSVIGIFFTPVVVSLYSRAMSDLARPGSLSAKSCCSYSFPSYSDSLCGRGSVDGSTATRALWVWLTRGRSC